MANTLKLSSKEWIWRATGMRLPISLRLQHACSFFFFCLGTALRFFLAGRLFCDRAASWAFASAPWNRLKPTENRRNFRFLEGRLRGIIPVDLRLETLGNAYEAGAGLLACWEVRTQLYLACQDDPWAQSLCPKDEKPQKKPHEAA